MKISTVFVDIDTTLADSFSGTESTSHVDLMIELVAHNNNISTSKARVKVHEAENSVKNTVGDFWPFGILPRLNVNRTELWEALAVDARKTFFLYHDAKTFLVTLKTHYPAVKIFTATTNPQLIILAKLATANMASENGSSYFTETFGGEEVIKGGKSSSKFYEALLKRSNSRAEETIMIGDHEKFDLQYAREAGINTVILPRRDQDEPVIHADNGGIYVNSLEYVKDFLK